MSKNGAKTQKKGPPRPFREVWERLVREGKARAYERTWVLMGGRWTEESPVTRDEVIRTLQSLRKTPV